MITIRAFKDLTRLEQTLFGLPYVLASILLSLNELSFHLRWLWVLPAFLLARVSGMAFNQLIDRYIDAKNPRTENRPLPGGRVSENQARFIACGGLLLFFCVCHQINALCFLLAPVAAFSLVIYSYLKRVTAGCHFVLGFIHFLSPVMASSAITGTFYEPSVFLGLGAACSIIGSDIIYALQDYEFDRKENLFSLPSRLGIEKSLLVARLMHLCALVFFLLVGFSARLPVFYFLVIPILGRWYYRFHKKMSASFAEATFFSSTAAIPLFVFGFILASFAWDVL